MEDLISHLPYRNYYPDLPDAPETATPSRDTTPQAENLVRNTLSRLNYDSYSMRMRLMNSRHPLRRLQHRMYQASAYANASSSPTQFVETTPANNSTTVFVPQEPRPAVDVDQPQSPMAPMSPDIVIYEPYQNGQAPANIDDSGEPQAPSTFSAPNNAPIDPTPIRNPPVVQPSSRCPYYRRLSMSGYNMPSHNPFTLQNGSYMRPAYAPHESLWYRQQNNQELHRRHMMNTMSGSNAASDAAPLNSFTAYPGRANQSGSPFCLQCDQHHPLGHPHRRIRQYVCGLNMVSLNFNFKKTELLKI